MSKVGALVAAAGLGQRLGLGPKAFVQIGGRTLLELAVTAFGDQVDELIVAVPEEHLERARRLLPDALLVAGGVDRQSTVRAMLAGSTSEVVVVHDVARPFLPPEVLSRVVAAAYRAGAATAALSPVDTVVVAADGEAVQREKLKLVQTPQGFYRTLLQDAHRSAAEAGFGGTDDAALVRRLGRSVELVEGSPLLSKLTTPADLELFEALNLVWSQRQAPGTARPRSAASGSGGPG